MSRIEALSNWAVIVTAAVTITVLVKQTFFESDHKLDSNTEQLVGKPLSYSGGQLTDRELTVVLVLSTNCRYCDESIPFYTKLSSIRGKSSGIRFVALFPQSSAAGKEYLQRNGIMTDKVISTRLADVGVRGTPALLLVESAKVQQVWLGRLPRSGQEDVLSTLKRSCKSCIF